MWQLTDFNVADHHFDAIFHDASSRILVPMRWAEWCEREAQWIGSDPKRQSAVVHKAKAKTMAVFVDLVAGEKHAKFEDDEEDQDA